MRDSTRRRFLRTGGVVGIAGLTGCSQITGGNDIKDTDGDGVIDSEDYAPRDPDVQDAEDVEQTEPAEENKGNGDSTQSTISYDWESGTKDGWTKTSVQYGSYTDIFQIIQNDAISGEYSPQTEVLNDRIGIENQSLNDQLNDNSVDSISGKFKINGDLDANFVNFNAFTLGPGRVVFYHQDREIRWNNGGAPDRQENPTILKSFSSGETYNITVDVENESFSVSVDENVTSGLSPSDGEPAEVNRFKIDCRNSGGGGPSAYDSPIYFTWDDININI